MATLRLRIFGREDLVDPGGIPDFSDIPAFKLISFFREAKFESLMMLPLRSQYLPTNTSNEDSNQSLREEKEAGNKEGEKWISHYLFHIPLEKGRRKSKKGDVNIEEINGVENEGGDVEDIMMGNGNARDGTIDRLINSQSNK